MSLLDQDIPVQRVKVRTVYGSMTDPKSRSKAIRRSLAQHRYYLKNREKKAADNKRRYRQRVEKLMSHAEQDAIDAARYRSMRADVVACNAGGGWPTWIGARTGPEVDKLVDKNIETARLAGSIIKRLKGKR